MPRLRDGDASVVVDKEDDTLLSAWCGRNLTSYYRRFKVVLLWLAKLHLMGVRESDIVSHMGIIQGSFSQITSSTTASAGTKLRCKSLHASHGAD